VIEEEVFTYRLFFRYEKQGFILLKDQVNYMKNLYIKYLCFDLRKTERKLLLYRIICCMLSLIFLSGVFSLHLMKAYLCIYLLIELDYKNIKIPHWFYFSIIFPIPELSSLTFKKSKVLGKRWSYWDFSRISVKADFSILNTLSSSKILFKFLYLK